MPNSAETTYRALIVNVMVAMMKVDGDIDDLEVEQICDICEEIVGFRLEVAVRERLIDSVVATREEVLDLVRTHGSSLDAVSRTLVIRAGLYVLEADARTDRRELQFLTDVGQALGMTREQVTEVLVAAREEGQTKFWRGG